MSSEAVQVTVQHDSSLMDLVGNPKADRFSRGVATALKSAQCTSVCSFFNFCNLNVFKI